MFVLSSWIWPSVVRMFQPQNIWRTVLPWRRGEARQTMSTIIYERQSVHSSKIATASSFPHLQTKTSSRTWTSSGWEIWIQAFSKLPRSLQSKKKRSWHFCPETYLVILCSYPIASLFMMLHARRWMGSRWMELSLSNWPRHMLRQLQMVRGKSQLLLHLRYGNIHVHCTFLRLYLHTVCLWLSHWVWEHQSCEWSHCILSTKFGQSQASSFQGHVKQGNGTLLRVLHDVLPYNIQCCHLVHTVVKGFWLGMFPSGISTCNWSFRLWDRTFSTEDNHLECLLRH